MNTQIKPIEVPLKGTGTQVFIRTSTEGIYESTGLIYWQLLDEKGQPLLDGNIHLSKEEVELWDDSMDYIENIVLQRLNLNKL